MTGGKIRITFDVILLVHIKVVSNLEKRDRVPLEFALALSYLTWGQHTVIKIASLRVHPVEFTGLAQSEHNHSSVSIEPDIAVVIQEHSFFAWRIRQKITAEKNGAVPDFEQSEKSWTYIKRAA